MLGPALSRVAGGGVAGAGLTSSAGPGELGRLETNSSTKQVSFIE